MDVNNPLKMVLIGIDPYPYFFSTGNDGNDLLYCVKYVKSTNSFPKNVRIASPSQSEFYRPWWNWSDSFREALAMAIQLRMPESASINGLV